jgi:hypothetical protein
MVNLNFIVDVVRFSVSTVMGNVEPMKTNTGTGFEENNNGVPWSLAEM